MLPKMLLIKIKYLGLSSQKKKKKKKPKKKKTKKKKKQKKKNPKMASPTLLFHPHQAVIFFYNIELSIYFLTLHSRSWEI